MRFNRTLVFLKDYLGDTVMASALVRSVAKQTSELQIVGSPMIESLLQYPDMRARFFAAGNLANIGHLIRMSRDVRAKKFDCVFLVNRSFRSALLSKLAGIPVRIGHATEGRGSLLTTKVPYIADRNECECYLDLARGVDLPIAIDSPSLWISDQERTEGKSRVGSATIGIQPGARHAFKQVRLDVWREVGESLVRSGRQLAFFGGKEERSCLEQLGLDGIDLVGKTSVRESIGALANLDLMLGGDTGVMHLAAAIGTPTITAFGPTPSNKWGWFQPPHQVLQAPNQNIQEIDSRTVLKAVEKALCVSV